MSPIDLEGAVRKIREAAFEALVDAAETIVKPDAVARTPLLMPNEMHRAGRVGGDQGGTPDELRRSARVTTDAAAGEVAISFDTPYAVKQHEDLDQHHEVGGAKFLETAVISTRGRVLDKMATRIREVTR